MRRPTSETSIGQILSFESENEAAVRPLPIPCPTGRSSVPDWFPDRPDGAWLNLLVNFGWLAGWNDIATHLMDKHGLSTTEVGVFLKWTAKNDNLKKARAAMKKPAKKSKQKTFIIKFLEAKRGKSIRRDSDL